MAAKYREWGFSIKVAIPRPLVFVMVKRRGFKKLWP
jgi:hypothetical protein